MYIFPVFKFSVVAVAQDQHPKLETKVFGCGAQAKRPKL